MQEHDESKLDVHVVFRPHIGDSIINPQQKRAPETMVAHLQVDMDPGEPLKMALAQRSTRAHTHIHTNLEKSLAFVLYISVNPLKQTTKWEGTSSSCS